MPSLPKYSVSEGEEESIGFLEADQSTAAHRPPQSTAAVDASPEGLPVVYQLRTDWPISILIPDQQAMSVIGKTREEAVRLIFDAFSDLRAVDEDRLEFYVLSERLHPIPTHVSNYARITGPAWARLRDVSVIRVGVRATPDDLERRRVREQKSQKTLAVFLVAIFLSACLIALLIHIFG